MNSIACILVTGRLWGPTKLPTVLNFQGLWSISSGFIFRPNRSITQMRRIVTDAVAWSVCLSVTIVSPAKTAGPIELPFGVWPRVRSGHHVLDGVHITHANGKF